MRCDESKQRQKINRSKPKTQIKLLLFTKISFKQYFNKYWICFIHLNLLNIFANFLLQKAIYTLTFCFCYGTNIAFIINKCILKENLPPAFYYIMHVKVTEHHSVFSRGKESTDHSWNMSFFLIPTKAHKILTLINQSIPMPLRVCVCHVYH